MDRHLPSSAPHSAQYYPDRPMPVQSRNPHSESIDSSSSYVQSNPYINHHNVRPHLARGAGTYSGPTNNQTSNLYPVALQSLAPKTFPGSSSNHSPYPAMAYNREALHTNRVATLPTHLPGYPNSSKLSYYPPQEAPAQLPTYPGPPQFEFIPNQSQPFLPSDDHAPTYQNVYTHQHSHVSSPQTLDPLPLHSHTDPPPPLSPASPEDEAELALAIAMSEKMVILEKEREAELRRQEEADFERVLALSMMDSSSTFEQPHGNGQFATSSKVQLDSPIWDGPSELQNQSPAQPKQSSLQSHSPHSSAHPVPCDYDNPAPMPQSQSPASNTHPASSADGQDISTDKAVTPGVQSETIFRSEHSPLANFAEGPPSERAPSPLHILAPEETSIGPDDVSIAISSSAVSRAPSNASGYSKNVLGNQRSESPSELAYHAEELDTPTDLKSPPLPLYAGYQSHNQHSNVGQTGIGKLPLDYHAFDQPAPTSSRTSICSAYRPPSAVSSSSTDSHDVMSSNRMTSDSSMSQHSFQSMPTSVGSLPPQQVTLVANSNQYIDPDLLMGVTIDFKPPVLLAQLRPLPGSIPNIVSLPYGKTHPLHIQAPSWKHLLKLLARMGNTRFEPTEKAKQFAVGSELKLRTVIQFLKIHPAGDDWRTILWFTIDHPVPPRLPNAGKYKNPHPDILPWSYELQDYPVLLRNGADSAMSKTYTIPASEGLPYPSLPMTFPNLALYLQAALDFSRQQKDDSNGYRKLSKMVQTCYHMDEPPNENGEKSSVGGLFKRVIKRGANKKKTGKTNNEETYEYITPFVPDEWG